MRPLVALALTAFIILGGAFDALASDRVALVIGNGAYKTSPLKNPANDARDMAAALKGMGFDVTAITDATLQQMENAVREFGAKLRNGGVGLFYYAGHGMQVAGENYLIPVDTKIEGEADVKFGALNAGKVLARMEDAGNELNIVALDACRTNPFAKSFRSSEPGLARMDAPKGSLIAYATAPGRVAADSGGTGRNGIYTGFLLQHMHTPGLKIEEILKRVRVDVVRTTADKQVPWESSSLIGDFFFVRAHAGQASLPVANVPATVVGQPAGQTGAPSIVQKIQSQKSDSYSQSDMESWHAEALLKFYKNNYPEALALFRMAAEKGYAPALYRLGSMYAQGQGVKKDDIQAIKLWRMAADKGYAEAQYSVGLSYGYGPRSARNDIESVKFFRKAAEQGHADAQQALALSYALGNGVNRDYTEAERWWIKAAEQGHVLAQRTLGSYYYDGTSGIKNYKEAAKWYGKAAEQGDAPAQLGLGIMYENGRGFVQNYPEAMLWIRRAAAQGYANAQGKLGNMYAQGRGVGQNFSEAVKWWQKAADQGNAQAQGNLGAMYYAGTGVPQDYAMAYLWSSLAAAQNEPTASKNRDLAASKMTPGQLVEVQQVASQWHPRTP